MSLLIHRNRSIQNHSGLSSILSVKLDLSVRTVDPQHRPPLEKLQLTLFYLVYSDLSCQIEEFLL